MRTTPTPLLAAAAAGVLALAACGSGSPSEQPSASPTAPVAAQECLPIPGDTLVVLADDQNLQTVDNIIPAVNAETAQDAAVLAALDEVSKALNTPTLVELNRRTDVDFASSADVAAEFVSSAGITAPFEGSGSLVVGAANFSENITLAEIYAVVLRGAGYEVEVRSIGSRELYLPALQSGELDVVPEYVGTVTEFLNKSLNGADAPALASGDLDATVQALFDLAGQSGLVFGLASEAQDQNAFAVTEAFAQEYGVTTLSELAEACGPIVLGGPAECPDRVFCQPGLEEVYGIQVASFQSLDVGGPLTKTALRQGEIALGLVFSSDGTLG